MAFFILGTTDKYRTEKKRLPPKNTSNFNPFDVQSRIIKSMIKIGTSENTYKILKGSILFQQLRILVTTSIKRNLGHFVKSYFAWLTELILGTYPCRSQTQTLT